MRISVTPGAHVAWSSWWPRRSFCGTVVSVGRKTAHVETIKADGRRKLRYVKLERLVVR